MNPQESNWGDLDPQTITQLKLDIRRAVADGVDDALRHGALRDAIAEGVTIGLSQTAMDEDLFDSIVERTAAAFRRSATQASGRIVVDGVTGLAKRAAWFAVLGILVYALGGWTGLAALFKTFTSHTA
jgi:hypothetical protein